jgi:hypothetical protein
MFSFNSESYRVSSTEVDTSSTSLVVVNYSAIAGKLIENAHYTYQKVNATFTINVGTEIPEAVREQVKLGAQALEKAQNEFQKGNYSAAAKLANEAMNHFGSALRHMYRLGVEDLTPIKDEVVGGLKAALERGLIYLDKINASIQRYEKEGYNVQNAYELTELAKEELEQALEYLEEGNTDQARGAFGRGKVLLEKLNNLLNNLIRIYKNQKVEQYVNQFMARVININQTIASLSRSVTLTNSASVQSALRLTNQNLQIVRNYIQINTSVNLTDLSDMVDDFEDTIEGLNGNGTGSKLSEMNKIMANIQIWQNSAERLVREGLNTSSINAWINQMENILNKMKEMFENGELDDIEDLIKEAKKKCGGVLDSFTSSNVGNYMNRFAQSVKETLTEIFDLTNRDSIFKFKRP